MSERYNSRKHAEDAIEEALEKEIRAAMQDTESSANELEEFRVAAAVTISNARRALVVMRRRNVDYTRSMALLDQIERVEKLGGAKKPVASATEVQNVIQRVLNAYGQICAGHSAGAKLYRVSEMSKDAALQETAMLRVLRGVIEKSFWQTLTESEMTASWERAVAHLRSKENQFTKLEALRKAATQSQEGRSLMEYIERGTNVREDLPIESEAREVFVYQFVEGMTDPGQKTVAKDIIKELSEGDKKVAWQALVEALQLSDKIDWKNQRPRRWPKQAVQQQQQMPGPSGVSQPPPFAHGPGPSRAPNQGPPAGSPRTQTEFRKPINKHEVKGQQAGPVGSRSYMGQARLPLGGQVTYLWDTGADVHVMARAIAQKLNLHMYEDAEIVIETGGGQLKSTTRAVVNLNGEDTVCVVAGALDHVIICADARPDMNPRNVRIVPRKAVEPVMPEMAELWPEGPQIEKAIAEDKGVDAVAEVLRARLEENGRRPMVSQEIPPVKLELAPNVSADDLPWFISDSQAHKHAEECEAWATKRIEQGIAVEHKGPRPNTVNIRLPLIYTNGRCVVNGAPLNRVIKDVVEPIPDPNHTLEQVRGQYYGIIDISQAFDQVRAEGIEVYVQAGKRTLKLKSLPQGSKVAPSHYARIMRSMDLKHAVNFFDDIIVGADTLQELAFKIDETLKQVNKYFRVNQKKVRIGSKVKALGWLLDRDSVRVDPTKIATLEDFAIPRSRKQLEQTAGLLAYLAKGVPGLALVQHNIARAMKGEIAVTDPRVAQDIRRAIQLVREAPPRYKPDWTRPFYLVTDASAAGYAGLLMQEHEDGEEIAGRKLGLIYAVSRRTNKAEAEYDSPRLELGAVRFALKSLRYFVSGRTVTLLTDHRSLIHTLGSATTRGAVRAQAEMEGLGLEVEYLPGPENVADAFSRLLAYSVSKTTEESQQETEPWTPEFTQSGEIIPPSQGRRTPRYQWGDRLRVPAEEFRPRILRAAHGGHSAPLDMERRVTDMGFTWPGLRQDAQRVWDMCVWCQRFKVAWQGFRARSRHNYEACVPMDQLVIDTAVMCAESEFPIALIACDVATRYTFIEPLRAKSAAEVADALRRIMSYFGPPGTLGGDNGAEFVGNVVQELLDRSGVKKKYAASYDPQGNGLAERTVRRVKESVYANLEGASSKDWFRFAPEVMLWMNTTVASATNSTPFELMFGRALDWPMGKRDIKYSAESVALRKAVGQWLQDVVWPGMGMRQSAIAEERERKEHLEEIKVGDVVVVKESPGEEARATRPGRVTQVSQGKTYQVEGVTGKASRGQIRPFKGVISNEKEYTVDKILEKRGRGANTRYLVHWRNYPNNAEHNTWEPKEHLANAMDKLEAFEKKINKK